MVGTKVILLNEYKCCALQESEFRLKVSEATLSLELVVTDETWMCPGTSNGKRGPIFHKEGSGRGTPQQHTVAIRKSDLLGTTLAPTGTTTGVSWR